MPKKKTVTYTIKHTSVKFIPGKIQISWREKIAICFATLIFLAHYFHLSQIESILIVFGLYVLYIFYTWFMLVNAFTGIFKLHCAIMNRNEVYGITAFIFGIIYLLVEIVLFIPLLIVVSELLTFVKQF
jgi:hypothetical protein